MGWLGTNYHSRKGLQEHINKCEAQLPSPEAVTVPPAAATVLAAPPAPTPGDAISRSARSLSLRSGCSARRRPASLRQRKGEAAKQVLCCCSAPWRDAITTGMLRVRMCGEPAPIGLKSDWHISQVAVVSTAASHKDPARQAPDPADSFTHPAPLEEKGYTQWTHDASGGQGVEKGGGTDRDGFASGGHGAEATRAGAGHMQRGRRDGRLQAGGQRDPGDGKAGLTEQVGGRWPGVIGTCVCLRKSGIGRPRQGDCCRCARLGHEGGEGRAGGGRRPLLRL